MIGTPRIVRFTVSLSLSLSLLLAAFAPTEAADGVGDRPGEVRYAISPIHLIDGTGSAIQRDVSIIIDGNRVEAIVAAAEIAETPVDHVVEGNGRYVIPGLWDMHVHFQEIPEEQMVLFPAWGITSVRDMGGRSEVVRSRREQIRSGEQIGPRIKASMFMLDAPFLLQMIADFSSDEGYRLEMERRIEVGNEEQAREAVRKAAAAGADFVKAHAIDSREAYLALADEAEKAGLRFAGHQPTGDVTLNDWIAARQHSVDHILGQFGHLFDQYPFEEREPLYVALREAEVHFVPTMVLLQAMERMNPADDLEGRIELALDHPQGTFVADELEMFWRSVLAMSPSEMPRLRDYARELHHLRELHAVGVGIMPGTDLGFPMVFAGYSLHDELLLFVDLLDMTEMEAIESATRVPAEFFGIAEDLGTIEPGKVADLVLLGSDPLEAIENTRSIEAVVMGGAYYDQTYIDEWLDGARARE